MGGRYSGETTWRRSRIAVRVAPPAAGAEWALTIPAGHVYRLRSIYHTLATSAVVANRTSRIAFGDGTSTILDVPAFAVQAASLTWRYAWFPESTGDQTGTGVSQAIPSLALVAGWTVGSATTNLDAGDAYSAVRLIVDDMTVQGGPANLDDVPDMIVGFGMMQPGQG